VALELLRWSRREISKERGQMVRWIDPRAVSEPTKPKNERSKVTRSEAIRLQCTECMGYQVSLIKDCPDIGCPLWTFRFGRGQVYTDVPMRTKDSYTKKGKK